MAVVTISRQYASGGSSIAGSVAQALGWTLIDNEFVDRVAERAGLTKEEVAEREEKVPSLIDRLARTLADTSPELFLPPGRVQPVVDPDHSIVPVTQAIITEAVGHGNTVIVGRGAQAFLAEREDVLHVFVAAPRAHRVDAAVERLGISPKEAARKVDETDAQRKAYVKRHYGRDWTDPTNYHVIVNTALLGLEQATATVLATAHAQFED